MDRYNQKDNLYQFVDSLRNTYNLSFSDYPINPIKLCECDKATEIIYHNFYTKGFCAAAIKGEKENTVILNSNRSTTELHFDCAHEMIHLAKHSNEMTPMFNCIENEQNSYIEWEANEGAAELIVPMRLLLPEIKKRSSSTWGGIKKMKFDLFKMFHVTDAVIQNRMESLKFEIDQYLNGTPLDEIVILSSSAQKDQGIQIKSLNEMEEELLTIALQQNKTTKPNINVFLT